MTQKLASHSEDFSAWYNEIVQKADLADYSPVRGCMVIKPYGYELWEAVKLGDFREDLYYRLNVVSLQIPPLRERKEDIPVLAEHFLKTFADQEDREPKTLSEKAMTTLLKHVWPGNVRELLNTLKRASVLAAGREIQVTDLGLTSEGTEPGSGDTFEEFLHRWLKEIVTPWNRR